MRGGGGGDAALHHILELTAEAGIGRRDSG